MIWEVLLPLHLPVRGVLRGQTIHLAGTETWAQLWLITQVGLGCGLCRSNNCSG
jgi:hypothetical protein